MGIFSVGARLVSKVLPKAVKPVAKKAYRMAKVFPDMVFGTSSEAFGQGFKAAKGSKFMNRLKSGFRSIEADVAAKSAGGKGFFGRLWKSVKDTPKDFKGAYNAARTAGKGPVKSFLKSLGKTTAKRMPLIGVALTAAIDGPEVFNAFKEGGIKEGLKEVAGVGLELGGMAAGAAIGSCFGPVGTIVGGIIGAFAGGAVRGKTFSERKEEAKQQQLYNDLKALGLSDEEIAYCIENDISVDDVKKALEENEEAEQSEEAETPEKVEQPEETVDPEPVVTPEPEPEPVVTPAPDPIVTPTPHPGVDPDKEPEQPSQDPGLNPVAPIVVDPTNPTNPVAPVNPTNPVDPTNPTNPVAPVNPTQPGSATNPSQMTNEQLIIMLAMIFQQLQQDLMAHDERMIELLRPQAPAEPTAPVAPAEPTEPSEPVAPTEPTAPVAPTEPEEAEEETTPADETEEPDNSTNPFAPNNGEYDEEDLDIDIDIHIGRGNKVTVDVNDSSNPFSDDKFDEEYKIKYAA